MPVFTSAAITVVLTGLLAQSLVTAAVTLIVKWALGTALVTVLTDVDECGQAMAPMC